MQMDRLLSGDAPKISDWSPIWLRFWVINWYWDDWTRVIAGKVMLNWHFVGSADPENLRTYYYIGYDLDGNELLSGVRFSGMDARKMVTLACKSWLEKHELKNQA